MLMLFVSPE